MLLFDTPLDMLRCGKHKGKSFQEVASTDRRYCAWVLRLNSSGNDVSPDLSAFAEHLRREHGGVLPFGAHKGSFFDEVLRDHPDYCSWAIHLPDASDTMKVAIIIITDSSAPPSSSSSSSSSMIHHHHQ